VSTGEHVYDFAALLDGDVDADLARRDFTVNGMAVDLATGAALAILVADPRAYGERWRWSDARVREVAALQRLVGSHDRVALFHAGEEVARQLPALLRAIGRNDAVEMPDFTLRPLLDGDEIAQLTGVPPGPELGRIRTALLDAEVRGEIRTRDEAVRFVARDA
jgi:tRNA nucleotidyltransferase/poly(A) polymerase